MRTRECQRTRAGVEEESEPEGRCSRIEGGEEPGVTVQGWIQAMGMEGCDRAPRSQEELAYRVGAEWILCFALP